jgi:hypothetical protein
MLSSFRLPPHSGEKRVIILPPGKISRDAMRVRRNGAPQQSAWHLNHCHGVPLRSLWKALARTHYFRLCCSCRHPMM